MPDAVTQTRLPAPVARVQHVLCAVAALLFSLAGGVSPEANPQSEDVSMGEILSVITFAIAVGWGLIAHQLVKRTRTAAQLSRASLIAFVITAVVVVLDFHTMPDGKLGVARMAVAALFLVAACVWLSRQRVSLAFWLPQEKLTRAAKQTALGKYRDWSTLIWFFAYALVWMGVLGLR